ncbi:MAG: ATP-grasp domain-containing protein [Oscillospiraceae bacterium]|nr:ATP-grasp domain-containing protein [Oscillospiraceae bacterium]
MKALVLAGGFPQIELLKQLKARGIETVLADYYAEPVAKPYADKFYRESTLDIDAITRVAKEEQVDFLITCCTDQALLTVAKVSEELGLPCYIDHQTGLNVTNKQYMKKVFNKFDIPTAKHVIMASYNEEQLAGLEFPLIVKPVDCNSSKGVKRCENHNELKEAVEKAISYSRTDTAIVEEFIDGEELSADVYVEDGVAHLLSVSSLDKIADNDKFVIFRGRYSSETVEKVHDLVQGIAQKIADAFGLVNSPMLIQMITDGRRAAVLEFSARTGGGVKFMLIKKASGFDVISAVIDLTLGNKPHVDKVTPENKFIANEFIYCKPGIFDHLENFEELKNEGVITEYCLFKWKGAEFDTIENSGDRVGGFTVQADTMEDLRAKHARAVAELKVIADDGSDLMRRDLLTNF